MLKLDDQLITQPMNTFNPNEPAWNQIQPLEISDRAEPQEGGVLLKTKSGCLHIYFYSFGVRFCFGTPEFGDYDMISEQILDQSKQSAEIIHSDESETRIQASEFHLKLIHKPFSFELSKAGKLIQKSPTDAHFVRDSRLPPLAKVDKGWFIGLELTSNEPIYGLGEKWGRLDKRGQLIRSYNHDALGVNAEISYKNTPFAWSPYGWGAFVHTPAPVTHGVGYAPWSQRAYGLLVEDSSLDLFLFDGQQGSDIINTYTELTGRAPVPPLWSLGTILSKAYYKDADELLATAREVRERNMPCDVITLDGRAWQDTDTRFAFEWCPKRYSDPAPIIDELKKLNYKICIWEYPLVSVKNPLFESMSEKGWLLKDSRSNETYRYKWDMSAFDKEVLTPLPDSGIVDFTHPDAYAFWRDSHKDLFDLGVDMIKADFGEQVEEHMLAHNGDQGAQLHNVYSLIYNRCVYEAAERYCKTGPFLFSRSAWTGSQKYPAQWGGDPQADWGGMAASIRGAQSWGMSGAPYYATDIGGFYNDKRNAKLFARWAQAAVFSAHMRLHGIGQREPWSYLGEDVGEQACDAVFAALRIRYQLLPYLYQTMQTASQNGLPVQRSMALAFPDDRAAWAFEDQFMFGEDMLIAPCLSEDDHVEFYLPRGLDLPSGRWRRFPSGEIFEGGKTYSMQLALNETAVFVPEGRQIPLGPAIEHTGELKDELAIEEIWPGGNTSE